MSERGRSILALAVIAASFAVATVVLAADAASDADRALALAERLKCPICTSESIADSPAQVSRDLFDLIEEKVAAGESDDEITDFFVFTYGEEVLLDPPSGGKAAVLWLAPIALLLLGGLAIAGRRSRTDRSPTEEELRLVARTLEGDDAG